MQWPTYVFASALFPSLERDSTAGPVPTFPEDKPAWDLLNGHDQGLKQQLIGILTSSKIPSHCTFDDKDGMIYIDDTATVEPGVHFIGPCYVGPNATIRHGAYIRQYSWICDGAIVGHCTEVKHSILLPGSQAPHFNYVGDSILGRDVNLGAGAKLSNLRNDGKEVILRMASQTIGSGLRKFGAILGEGCAIGCNVVTNPGVVLGKGSVVLPNTTVTGIHPEGSSL